MSSPPARLQLRVLSARYRACMLGDLGTLVVLVAQAPLIGWLCTVVWGQVETDTPSLYFVLALSSVWFGCINACREIVKERAIVERERLLGLSIPAYIGSRFLVLSGVSVVQVIALIGVVEASLALRGPLPLQVVSLCLAALAGVGLGLTVSAVSTSQERAVGVVPLLILPQILFSDLAVSERYFSDAVRMAERCMPVHWAYTLFKEAAEKEPVWGDVFLSLMAQFGVILALATTATLALLRRRDLI